MKATLCAAASMAILAGCAGNRPELAKACNVDGGGRGNTFARLTIDLRNEGQWCSVALRVTGSQVAGAPAMAVTQRPSHGDARVSVNKQNQSIVSYRPDRGYTGGDNFAVMDEPSRLVWMVSVSVAPPLKLPQAAAAAGRPGATE
jgi:hypothetical protein